MKRKNERPPRQRVYDIRIHDRRTRTGWIWSTKLVSAVRAAILSVNGRPWRNTAEVICPRTDHISSTAARMTFMNPPSLVKPSAGICDQRRPTGRRKAGRPDRKSTRLNSSHRTISYAVFCLKKKKKTKQKHNLQH